MTHPVDEAWDLRTRDPSRAVALAQPWTADPDDVLAAKAGAILGYALLRMGRLEESDAALAAAGDLVRRSPDRVAEARVHVGVGALRMAQAKYGEAASGFRRAQAIFARLGDRGSEAGALVNLGLVHRHLGDAPRALELLLDGASRFREEEDAYGEAVALVNMAQVHGDLGDKAAARVRIEEAWGLVQGLGRPPFEVFVRTAYGVALAAAGDRAAGEQELTASVEAARALEVPSVLAEALGGLARIVGPTEPARARVLIDEALGLLEKAGNAWTLAKAWLTLADFAETPADGRVAAEWAASYADQNGEQSLSQQAHRRAAELCEQLGDAAAALAHWRASAAAADELDETRRSQRLALVEVSLAVQALRAEGRRDRARIAELMQVSHARSELVGMLAHELRNPLSTAELVSDLLKAMGGPALGPQLEMLEAAHDRMSRILDSTIADARAERTEQVLQIESTDLGALVRAIVDEHRSMARDKSQQLLVEADSGPWMLDSGRIFHAVANLLSNAMKFSPHGATVRVQVVIAADVARVQIDDEGPGVPDEDPNSLFEPFALGKATPTGGERSTGLGLHIARRMVELHGGTIGVAPGPDGVGASFWFELPAVAI